jgi:biotin carboxylase
LRRKLDFQGRLAMAHIVFVDSTVTGLNAFQTAKRLGHEVTFIRQTKAPSFIDIMLKDPARLQPFLAYTDRYLLVDTLEETDLGPALRELAREHPFDALLSTAETGIGPVAREAERFGLLYPSVAALDNAVFKNRCRSILARHHLRSPRFEVLNEQDLAAGPRDMALPYVVKPIRGFAKQYSAICRTQGDFDAYIHELRASRERSASINSIVSHDYIVEAYVEGTLHSAEVIVRQGKVMRFASTTRYRAHYYDLLELAAVMPSGLSEAQREEISRYLQAVFNVLGIQVGLYHVELLMSAQGPVLVEINARMMGSVSPIMYQQLTGQDPFEHLIRLHLGEPLSLGEHGFNSAGLTLAVAARHGGLIRSDFKPEHLRQLLDDYGIPHHTLNIQAGKHIDRYEGNLSIMGHVICPASDPEAAARKGHQFLCEIDGLIGLETAKYFA